MGSASPRTRGAIQRGRHTTTAEHMPTAHHAHMEWTPSRIMSWAGTIGPQTRALAQAILIERTHPEQGYRSCLGHPAARQAYGDARLEAACARALAVGARSYRHVDSILRRGLDRAPLPTTPMSRRASHPPTPRERPRTELLQLRRNASC